MRKWWLLVALALCCLAGCAQAQEFYFTKGYIVSDGAGGAVIYESNSEDSRMLGCALPGAPVTVVGFEGEWRWIHLGHTEDDDLLLGYVRGDRITDEASPLVSMTLEEAFALDSQKQNVRLATLEAGARLELAGQTDEYWLVSMDGRVGTVPLDALSPDADTLALLDADYLAKVAQDAANRQAMQAYQEEMTLRYSPDSRAWPLEQREHFRQLQERCGILDAWVDELPAAGELDQQAATELACQCFQEMWGVDPTSEGWHIFVAFGYNRMEPKVRLWQFTFQEGDAEENSFRMQLTASDGEVYRTSSAEAFLISRRAGGYSPQDALQDTLDVWTERLGREPADWTIDEQYAFANLPIAKVLNYNSQVTVPNAWEIPMDEALSTAKLGLMYRYGLEEAQLDDMRVRVMALDLSGARKYQFSWSQWNEEESMWTWLYVAEVDMGTGGILNLQGPGEGNG